MWKYKSCIKVVFYGVLILMKIYQTTFFIQVNNIVNNRQQNQLKDIKYLALLLWKRNVRTKQDLEHFF